MYLYVRQNQVHPICDHVKTIVHFFTEFSEFRCKRLSAAAGLSSGGCWSNVRHWQLMHAGRGATALVRQSSRAFRSRSWSSITVRIWRWRVGSHVWGCSIIWWGPDVHGIWQINWFIYYFSSTIDSIQSTVYYTIHSIFNLPLEFPSIPALSALPNVSDPPSEKKPFGWSVMDGSFEIFFKKTLVKYTQSIF